jgi:hypothetical protein
MPANPLHREAVPEAPNRLGIDTRVYLASAELAAVAALLGRLPTPAEYLEQVKALDATSGAGTHNGKASEHMCPTDMYNVIRFQ